MHFFATMPDFVGAVVVGIGLGIGYTAGCWIMGHALGVLRIGG